MPLVVTGISMPFTRSPDMAIEEALAQVRGCAVSRCYLVKKYVDARRKQDIRFVYSVGIEREEDEKAAVARLCKANIL